MTNPLPVIAIDGTAASGKGTLSRRLAGRLGYAYLDTGLLYRRVALTLLQRDMELEDQEAATTVARLLRAEELGDPDLRGAEAGRGASIVGAIPGVRQALLDFQRHFALTPPNLLNGTPAKGAILDGRDIGTAICPDANVKFFVDAKIETRAMRRHNELLAKGERITYETVLDDMKTRDARDAGRGDAPMMAAHDAIHLDTTHMGPDEVFAYALEKISAAIA
jgi:cytidylate kinase